MNIRTAEARHLAIPTGLGDIVLPSGAIADTDLNVLLLRLVDDDGAEGYSYVWGAEQRQIAVFRAMLEYLGGEVVGAVASPSAARSTLRRATNFVGYDGVASFGVAAFEMALHDLDTRRRGVSLGRSLGRRRDRLRACRTGCLLPYSIDEIVHEAAEIAASGVLAIKMQVGKPDLGEDLDRVEAVKEALPTGATLMVDATQHFDVAHAVRAAEGFAALGISWFEDPIDYADLDGYARIVEASPVPIATGENQFGLSEFGRLIDLGVRHVVADLERVGGIDGWLAVAGMVADRGGLILPHLYPSVSAQLMSTVCTTEPWIETVPWFDAIVDAPLRARDGWIEVPDVAGAGFRPRPDAIDDLAVGPWEPLGPSSQSVER